MSTEIKLNLSPAQLNTVLIALGNLPYIQVHELIEQIQNEAGPQLLKVSQQHKMDNGQEDSVENNLHTISGR